MSLSILTKAKSGKILDKLLKPWNMRFSVVLVLYVIVSYSPCEQVERLEVFSSGWITLDQVTLIPSWQENRAQIKRDATRKHGPFGPLAASTEQAPRYTSIGEQRPLGTCSLVEPCLHSFLTPLFNKAGPSRDNWRIWNNTGTNLQKNACFLRIAG